MNSEVLYPNEIASSGIDRNAAHHMDMGEVEKKPRKTYIFVYGTLLSGESNNPLLASAKLVGSATTRPYYQMFSNGGFPYVKPQLESSEHLGYPIKGEVYEVDASTLARLDRLEGVPHHYRRENIEVQLKGEWRAVDIYLCYGDTSRLEEIEDGDWKARNAG